MVLNYLSTYIILYMYAALSQMNMNSQMRLQELRVT